MAQIKYLHLSDLHLGDKHQKGLISQVKKVLFQDIEYVLSKLNGLDVVFFTGDFVQKGTKEEFDLLESFLRELWDFFGTHNCNPYLVCVPGNHDLERCHDLNNPAQKVFSNWTNDEIKKEYFWTNPNAYHDFIKERFKNYENWYATTQIRKPDFNKGYIPGDFYCSINFDGLKLGIVGLNSAFLQLASGNVKGKLGIYNSQISIMFGDKYIEWFKNNHFAVLLTHHSPDWFEPDSIGDFNHEIYVHDNYIELLCGHMHEPMYTSTSINGFPAKKYFVSPSLFGLEFYDKQVQRIHGYTAGVYDHNSERIQKTIWPRKALQTNHGLKIVQNDEFNLDKDTASLTEVMFDYQESPSREVTIENLETIKNEVGNLFSKKQPRDRSLLRTYYHSTASHSVIRGTERSMCIRQINSHNISWVVSSYGLGEEEFIGSILKDIGVNAENCFSISCAEATTIEEVMESFKTSFSKNITQFFDIINSLENPLLVMNSLHASLVRREQNLKEFIQTLFDFSPNLKIIIVGEVAPKSFFEFIELVPLDIPGVKLFVEASQDAHGNFTFLEYEKIHRITSGIPLYIDKVIEQLKFRPLSDLTDIDLAQADEEEKSETLSKAIMSDIKTLRKDDSKLGVRRFTLLRVLSLLHNGETYERIKRYDPALPFYPDDVTYLINNKLIETIQVNSLLANNSLESELVKIIRVPRLIRDYISSLFSTEEKLETYKRICNIYLGANWRDSIKLVQLKDAELDLIVHQNLQLAIRFILLTAVENQNETETILMTRISLDLIEYFSDKGSYKEAAFLSEETLLIIKDVGFTNMETPKIQLMKKLGENLRMTSVYDKAIPILKSICDDENNLLSKKDRNSIRVSLAYGYKSLNNRADAIKYAELAKSNEKDKESWIYLTAESIIAHYIEKSDERIRRLNSLKNKASKLKYNILKANLILELTNETKDESDLKNIEQIIRTSGNSTYTKVRALVAKAKIVLNTKNLTDITQEDLLSLNISYSYCFYQRLEVLLTKCHVLAWEYWSKQNRYDYLLNLFRYSSFVWRLCGKGETEKQYLQLLQTDYQFMDWFKSNKLGVNSSYFEQRLQVIDL